MDNDPQPRRVFDRGFTDEIFNATRDAMKALYPQARIPETPMPYDPHRLSEIERASLQRAAPELYEALAALVSERHEHESACQCPWCNARAVMSKARGDGGSEI